MTRGAFLVFALAFALRLVTIAELRDEPLFRSPQLDALEYVAWGAQLSRGDFTWPVAPIHGPGYPFLIAAVLALTNSLLALQIVQAALGSIAAVLTFDTTRRMFGPGAGIAAGLLHATYAPLILIDISILAEGLFVFLLTLSLWFLVRFSTRSIVAAGIVLGLAIIVRPTAAVLVPLFAFFVFRAAARGWLALSIFVAAVAWPVLPVLIQNRTATEGLLGVQASGGRNFYIGNSPLHDGTAWARPGGRWDVLHGAPWRAGISNVAGADRFHVRRTFGEITEHPARFIALLGSKFRWLTQDEEIRDSHSFHFFAESSLLLRWLPRFAVVVALAVCGAFVTRRRPGWWLLAGYTILMALTVVGLVAGFRYRIPIMPALFVFAGAALASATATLAQRRIRSVAIGAFVFILVFASSNVYEHAPSHNLAEEVGASALSLKNEGSLDDAARAAAQATELDPESDFAWTVTGDIAALRGRWDEAERAWRRAIDADPNNARAWSHLAHIHFRRGEMSEAEAMLKRALSIKYEREAAENLARLRSRG